MTNQEIIEQLESLKSHCEDFRDGEDSVWAKDVEALDAAIEALEKQVPKKPVGEFSTHALYNNDGSYLEQLDIATFRCPHCKCIISEGEISKEDCIDIHYCDICGQAIVWEDE